MGLGEVLLSTELRETDTYTNSSGWSSEKLAEGYYATFSTTSGTSGRLYIKTYQITGSQGQTITLVDSWTADIGDYLTLHYTVKLASTIYAIRVTTYNAGAYSYGIRTISISDTGVITKSWIAVSADLVDASYYKWTVARIGTTNYYAEYGEKSAGYLRVRILSISADGTTISITSTYSWSYAGTPLNPGRITYAEDNYIIVGHTDTIYVLEVVNGTITQSIIDSEVLSSGFDFTMARGYFNFYVATGRTLTSRFTVRSFVLSATGQINWLDAGSNFLSDGGRVTLVTDGVSAGYDADGNYLIILIAACYENSKGYSNTIRINRTTHVSTLVHSDTITPDSVVYSDGPCTRLVNLIALTGHAIFACVYRMSVHQEITIISTDLDLTSMVDAQPADLPRVSAIRHIYRPGSYRAEITLGGVSTDLVQTIFTPPTVAPATPPLSTPQGIDVSPTTLLNGTTITPSPQPINTDRVTAAYNELLQGLKVEDNNTFTDTTPKVSPVDAVVNWWQKATSWLGGLFH